MSRISPLILGLALTATLGAAPPGDAPPDPEYGVYVNLVRDIDVPLAEAAQLTMDALAAAGWEVLSVRPSTCPTGCPFGARVMVVHSPGYAAALAPYGPQAAFAVPLRVAVFEDEGGVQVAALDLRGLNRTMVDERVPASAWEPWHGRLVAAVEAAFPGKVDPVAFGQMRDQGRITRTFGVMAGGPFVDKIEVAGSVPAAGTTVQEVARRVEEAFATGAGGEWGLEAAYRVELPDLDAAVVGVTGGAMEAKAFEIVRHGGNGAREGLACPGVDHAAAFPIELVVVRSGDVIEVRLVDEMFRMKMFFEDAGTVAFAKNMGMPGSIEDEIRGKVAAALGG